MAICFFISVIRLYNIAILIYGIVFFIFIFVKLQYGYENWNYGLELPLLKSDE